MKGAIKTIGDLIDNVENSILSTVDSEGFPNTRAML